MKTSRTPLIVSVIALVVALVGLGGPVVARAYDALNSHKVDGKHAVGANASATQRRGKLVATNRQGRLPNTIIAKAPDADRLDGLDSTDFQRSGQTTQRTVSIPAQALNVASNSSVVTRDAQGLRWDNSFVGTAEWFLKAPDGYTGGAVTVKLFMQPDPGTFDAGAVQFYARPRDYNSGDIFSDTLGPSSEIRTLAAGNSTQFFELTMVIDAGALPKDWWDIVVQRSSSVTDSSTGEMIVKSASLTYPTTAE